MSFLEEISLKNKNMLVEYLTEIHRAVRFLYLISQSFASRCDTYGYKTVDKPAPQIFYQNKLEEVKNRLRNTVVENLSFETIVEKYDRPHSFFFCDPPHFDMTGYGYEFGEREHLLLRDKLINLEGRFLLTINDHSQVREWYIQRRDG